MNTLIKQYAAYGRWANGLFVERLQRESDAVLDAVVKSSFPSLRLTLLHMRNAECAWYLRVAELPMRWPAEEGSGLATVLPYSDLLHDHVMAMTEEELERPVSYSDLRGNAHTQPRWEMLMHCFNHSSYHRGQLVTMMRELGLSDIPGSDLIGYQRLLRKTSG